MKNQSIIKTLFWITSLILLFSAFSFPVDSSVFFQKENTLTKDTLTTPHLFCSQKRGWENAIAKNPTLEIQHQQWEEQMFSQAAKNSLSKPTSQFDLPVVVHIIHENGDENISDAQVEQGIEDLNAAFANEDYYAQTFGVDTEIQFCLATQDPNGNFTTGINRVVSPLTEMNLDVDDLDLKNLIRWNPDDYINIWLVKKICDNTGDCSTAGYAYFPSAHGSDIDGIVEEAEYFGSTSSNSSVTVHEMGHYLGLYHTFEGGCLNDDCLANGDRVCDTPPDQTTIPGPCNSSINSCTSDVNLADPNNPFTTDQDDNSSNFMDYGLLGCLTNFTAGQTVRMQNSIVNIRSSLLDSPGCSSACPTPIIANFEVSNNTIELGGTVSFTNTSTGGLYFDWTVNQDSFDGISYTFDSIGTFEITLVITNNDPNCIASFSQNIIVTCGAQAAFTVDALQIPINTSASFIDNSTNATSTFWTVDGIQVSSDPNYQFSSPNVGFYTVCLLAENGICQTDTCVIISVLGNSSGNEICDNGLDDDGDGLIDCYDPDCCETANCINNSFSPCEEEGCDPPIYNEFEMQLKWSTPTISFEMGPLGGQSMGGNVAGDGVVGILEGRRTTKTVRLKDGSDGSIIWSIGNVETGGPLIADVDLDGTAEIFLISEEIVRLEHDGTFTGTNDLPSANYGGWFSGKHTLADFNQDGIPEIFALGHLINTQNLEILSSVPLDIFPYYFQYGVGIPVDVLPASPSCPDCDGLELVAGPFVFSVHPTTFEFTLIHSVAEFAPFYTQENTTSIADMDNDGDLDCVVYGVGDPNLYIWDIQTPTFIAVAEQANFPFIIGYHNYPAIADMDNDGFPEVICRTGNDIVAFNHDLASYDWVSPITEFGGNATQVIFDVNGDGNPEVIYRDNALLRIINGQTGELLSSIACQSGTSSESPSILDVDGDGQAEIGCECSNRTHIFEAAGDKPWAGARNFYDQFPTFHVQRNDDLTTPQVQQQHQVVGDGNILNSFLQIYSIPFDPIDCDEICGNGIDDDNDGLIDCEDDDCCLDVACDNQPTPCDTCIFVGNIDLGPDLETCDNGILNFNAGSGFSSYLWSDQSSDSTFTSIGAGTIWVVATDSCGTTYTDTVIISNIATTEVNLGADILLCPDDSVQLSGGIFDNYEWFKDDILICDGCSEIMVNASDEGEYVLLGSSNLGCFSIDTINVSVLENAQTTETILICDGDSIEVFGQTIFQDSILSQSFISNNGCDSIHIISVEFIPNFQSNENVQICEGDSIDVFGQIISQDSILSQNFIAANGCDSIHTITVEIIPIFQTQETLQICEGTSIDVFGQIISQDSILSQNFIANNGCDSIHTVSVEVNQIFQSDETFQICEGDSIEIFGLFVSENAIFNQSVFSTNGCDSILTVTVEVIETIQTDESIQICQGDSIDVFGQIISQDSILSQNFIAANGCDSTHTITVQVNQIFQTNENVQICVGDSIEVFGQIISQDSILSQNFIALNGCDSTHIISVEILETFQTGENIFACDGDAINILGQTFLQDTIIFESLISANGCDSIHQFNLFFEDEVTITNSTILCGNESIIFFDDTITTAGFYEFIQTPLAGNCDTIFQLTVESSEIPNPDFIITVPCPDENVGAIEIINSQNNWMYSLDGTNFQANPFFENIPIGNYELWVEDDLGCENQLAFEINQQTLIEIQMPVSITQNVGDTFPIPINYSDTNNLIFSWSPSENLSCDNCPFPSAVLQNSQIYTLTILDSIGCEQTANIEILVNDIPNVFIPNAFTPNGDDFNDRFTIYGNSLIEEVEYLRIFDRWGELVFEAQNFNPNDETKGWDGFLKGKAVLQGVYVYTCEVKTSGNQRLEFSGDLTLIR